MDRLTVNVSRKSFSFPGPEQRKGPVTFTITGHFNQSFPWHEFNFDLDAAASCQFSDYIAIN